MLIRQNLSAAEQPASIIDEAVIGRAKHVHIHLGQIQLLKQHAPLISLVKPDALALGDLVPAVALPLLSLLVGHMIGNADQLRTSLGLTAGPDQAGYKKAVTELEKQHGQNRARISSSNAEDKDMQLEALDAQLEQSKAALADTFGMTSKAEEQKAGAPIKEWTGGDAERLQFVKEANQHGKLSSLLDSPARMNTAFELWRQQAAKQRQTEQAVVTANRLRDTETNAYQAMSLAQARR